MKRRGVDQTLDRVSEQHAMLVALNDDLALPLIQIKTALELIDKEKFPKKLTRQQLQSVSLSTEAGLQLIDAYRLTLKIRDNQNMPLEPVSVAGVLQEVAHHLNPYAKQYNTELIVDVQGKLIPVLAHHESLVMAIQCLGSSMIRAQAAQEQRKNYKLMLGAHRSPENAIAAGVFSNVSGLSDRTLRAARSLAGKARQPFPSVPVGAASGILIADMLCSSMWEPLRAAAHRNMGGLAIAVPITKQLNFV